MHSRGLWSTVWIAALTTAFAYLAAVPSARSADLPAPGPVAIPATPVDLPASTPGPGDYFEVRFGAFDHGVGSVERNTVDINGSILTPRLNVGVPGYWAYLLPRFQLGGAVNLAGRTSFAYADIALTLPIIPIGCSSNRLSVAPYTMGACTVHRRCPPSAVLSCFTPARRLASPSPHIGACSALSSTCRTARAYLA